MEKSTLKLMLWSDEYDEAVRNRSTTYLLPATPLWRRRFENNPPDEIVFARGPAQGVPRPSITVRVTDIHLADDGTFIGVFTLTHTPLDAALETPEPMG